MKRRPIIFYGWVIVAAAFVWISIGYGVRFSFSVFYPAILDEFGWSRAFTASIYSINIAVYGLTAPLVGLLVDKFRPQKVLALGALLLLLGTVLSSQAREIWQFYLTFGVLTASGTCMAGLTPITAILSRWFVRRRGAVLGIISAGTGLSFLYGTFVQYLIATIDWPAAYLVLGAMVAFILLPLVVFVPRHGPEEMGLLPDGDSQKQEAETQSTERAETLVLNEKWAATDWSLPKALKTYRFWALFFAMVCNMGFAMLLVTGHQVKFLEDVGYSTMFAAIIYGGFGIMFTVGNLFGFLADRIGREMTFIIGGLAAMLGVFFLLLIGDASQPWLPVLYAIAFGFGLGITGPAIMASVADIFQGKHLGSIFGTTVLGFALGGTIGPWLGGRIHDVTDSYKIAFILIIAVLAVGLAFIWISSPRKVRLVPGRSHLTPNQSHSSRESRER